MSEQKPATISLATSLSEQAPHRGLVELRVNELVVYFDLPKAREVCKMLHLAIEAAAMDEAFVAYVTKYGADTAGAATMLQQFRSMRATHHPDLEQIERAIRASGQH